MAFFSKEQKKEIAPKIKEICKKYGIKASLSIKHNSTIVLKIKSGIIDFEKNCTESNFKDIGYILTPYNYEKIFSEVAKKCLIELYNILFHGNYDNSDSMSDYFDVGWYVDVKIGLDDKPYILTN